MARPHSILTVLLLSAAPAVASPTPPPDTAVAKPLLELRTELMKAGSAQALAQIARFRPLCDKDGYPLVGNVASKGDRYHPSQFCRDVRAAEKPR